MFHAAETQIISSYVPLLYVCILLVHLSHQITDDGLNDENINEFPMLIIQTFRVMHSCHILHVHLFLMHFLTQVSCRFDTLHLCSCVCAFLHGLCLCGCVFGCACVYESHMWNGFKLGRGRIFVLPFEKSLFENNDGWTDHTQNQADGLQKCTRIHSTHAHTHTHTHTHGKMSLPLHMLSYDDVK